MIDAGSEIPKVIDRTSENPRFIRTDELSAEFGGFAERVNMPAAYIGPATATGSKAGPVQFYRATENRGINGDSTTLPKAAMVAENWAAVLGYCRTLIKRIKRIKRQGVVIN